MTVLSGPAALSALSASGVEAARQRGLLLVAAAALLWSTGGLFVRWLGEVDVWTTVFWRSLFAGLFLIGFILWRERGQAWRLFRAMGRPGLLVGLCFATASTCLVVALSLTSVANTLIIFSTSPMIAALLGRAVLGERVALRSWLTMLAALVGVAIMVLDSAAAGTWAGDLVAFVLALGLAVATVTIRKHRDVRMTPATCFGALLAAAIALPLAQPLAVGAGDFSLLILFGSLQFGAGLALFATGARLAPAAQVALIALLEPILGPFWVWGLLGESPGTAGLIGGGIVLAALALYSLFDLRRSRPSPSVA